MSDWRSKANKLSENDIKEIQSRMFDLNNSISEEDFCICAMAIEKDLTVDEAKQFYIMYLGEYAKVKYNLK